MNHIPVGMEMFPATGSSQWDHIKRAIDDSDYYVLIIGGRYGSVTLEGVSFTEREFDYALTIGLKPLVFPHRHPEDIPAKHTDPAFAVQLAAFRTKTMDQRLARHWETPDELAAAVTTALHGAFSNDPRPGWVRANASGLATAPDLYSALASPVTIRGPYSADDDVYEWSVDIKWGEIWCLLAPHFERGIGEEDIEELFQDLMFQRFDSPMPVQHYELKTFEFERVGLQFSALKLARRVRNTMNGTLTGYSWEITRIGRDAYVEYPRRSPAS